jgi:hypothetical protein
MNCPYCHKPAIWTENKMIYGRNMGDSYMIYYCKECDARVGCHQNTKHPLGTMANKELRVWRQKAHKAFDVLWKSGLVSRTEAYKLLAHEFSGKEIHMGEADIETCQKIIRLCTKWD